MVKKIATIISLHIIAFALLCPVHCEAKVFNKKNSKVEVDIYELSIDENISIPDLGKQAKIIAEFQNLQVQELNRLKSKGYPYDIKQIRDGEVIMITVPARNLFNQNETYLTDSGKETLKPLLKYLDTKQLYKIVLAMHSDNTGNDIYTMDLTTKRVNSIFDWMGENDKSKTDFVVPYALGSADPLVDNNSVVNRDKNRRLVIYLIPDDTMINQAKRNKIAL